MGALHAGHASLIERSRTECDVVVVSIFVNPRQFSDGADLARYPRTEDDDLAVCERAGADVVVIPDLAVMWPAYPAPTATTVSVAGLATRWEGVGRPGHFDGVTSVVAKLFAITGPCAAYFGEKDYQQLAVVSQMVADLGFDVDVIGCPIVRDTDGLALSSRNVRLSQRARGTARALSQAITELGSMSHTVDHARSVLGSTLTVAGLELAYADVVDPSTLDPIESKYRGEARALVAGVVDGVRLLDNGPVTIVGGEA
jgi:pantoate--beta-alanine ligase